MTIKYLIQKEFLQIRRNAFLPRLIVLFPILIMCVVPWVMNMEVNNIVVDVVDHDHSARSRQLAGSIEASDHFVLHGYRDSYPSALADIEQGLADMVVVVPPNYSRDLSQGRQPQVLVAANAVNGTKGGMGSAYLSQIAVQNVAPNASAIRSAFSTLTLYNRHQNYKLFMIPALLAIVIMLMTGFLPTLNIVGEKEAGTIEQINVTPVSKRHFILAKMIPYWLIALFVIGVSLLLAWGLYGIGSAGPLWMVFALAMLLALFFSAFGLLVSNYSDSMQQAIFVMWFFVVCLMLLSGLFTPTRSMPSWAYLTTYINPVHYFIDAVRTVFVRGGGLEAIAGQLAALGAIGLGMAAWAVMSYKKNN